MTVFVLHDQRRPDEEWELCRHELDRQGIAYQLHFVTHVPGQSTVENINFNHKQLVALAKFHNLPEVCIMESDVMFPAVDGWDYFLSNTPPMDFDLYVAARYSTSMTFFRELRYHIPFSWIPTGMVAGLHCYIIRAKYYDKFLSMADDDHIDTIQHGGEFFVCYPFAAIQRESWSANHKSIQNFNGELLPQDVYGWE